MKDSTCAAYKNYTSRKPDIFVVAFWVMFATAVAVISLVLLACFGNAVRDALAAPVSQQIAVSVATVRPLATTEKYVVDENTHVTWQQLERTIVLTGYKTYEEAYERVERTFDVGGVILWPPQESTTSIGRRFKARCVKVVVSSQGDGGFVATGHYEQLDQ